VHKDSQKTTAVLRSTAEIARDFVHSAASLSIGPDFAYKGQVDKTLFFPKPFVLFPEREVGSQNLRGGHPRELLPSKPNTFDSQPNKATF